MAQPAQTHNNTSVPIAKFTIPSRPLTFLVTGCSSGLGLSLARAVQAAGHNLVATSRNPSRTPELVAEVEAKGGKWLALDVDEPDCGKIIDELEGPQHNTPVDVLVNNAGWSIHQALEHFTDDEVRAQMETVFYGPFRLMRAALPYVRKRRSGALINISSAAGLESRESMGVYAAAKAALDAVSKVMYKEVAEFNVRVLTVHLGGFRTNMGNVCRTGANPRAEDYKGTVVDQTIEFMTSSRSFVGDGDPDKAARIIVEMATGTGSGSGREAEMSMPMGKDAVIRAKLVRDRMSHAIGVFEEVASSVSMDSK